MVLKGRSERPVAGDLGDNLLGEPNLPLATSQYLVSSNE